MIDAHCHLDLFAPEQDPAEALRAARAVGVERVVVAGVDPDGWRAQAALAQAHMQVSCTYGLHPWTVAAAKDEEIPGLLAELTRALDGGLGQAPVGLGELGLDFGRRGPKPTRARQELAFRAQLALARDRNLPVVLHLVAAPGRALQILGEEGLPQAGGMIHRYSGHRGCCGGARGGPERAGRGYCGCGVSTAGLARYFVKKSVIAVA